MGVNGDTLFIQDRVEYLFHPISLAQSRYDGVRQIIEGHLTVNVQIIFFTTVNSQSIPDI